MANAFRGHQQLARTKWLSKLPYYHLLPMPIYKMLLKLGGEQQDKIDNLAEIKATGISIEQFEQYAKRTNYNIVSRTLFLIRPIYRFKFGLKLGSNLLDGSITIYQKLLYY